MESSSYESGNIMLRKDPKNSQPSGFHRITPLKEPNSDSLSDTDASDGSLGVLGMSSSNSATNGGHGSIQSPAVASSSAQHGNNSGISAEDVIAVISKSVYGYRCNCGAALPELHLRKHLWKHFGRNNCNVLRGYTSDNPLSWADLAARLAA